MQNLVRFLKKPQLFENGQTDKVEEKMSRGNI